MTDNPASQQGQIYMKRGNLSQACKWFEQAVQEAREQQHLESLSAALGNLGNVSALMEHYDKAEACYQEILAIQRTQDDLNAVGETLVNLGNLKAEKQEEEKARAYYLEAIDMLSPLDNHRALGIAYSNLALQEVHHLQYESGIEYFQQALDFHRTVGDEHGLANTFSQLGKTFLLQGHTIQAERCLNNASEHFIKLGQETNEAAVLRLLGELYQGRGDGQAARRCWERVLQIDLRYQLPQYEEDRHILTELTNEQKKPPHHPSREP